MAAPGCRADGPSCTLGAPRGWSAVPSPPGKITYGRQLRSLEVGGFIFTETLHEPRFVLARHDHECANFNLTLRGHCLETMRGRTEICGPSTLVVKPPGECHANRYGPSGAQCLIVEITPGLVASLGRRTRLLDAPARLQRGPLVDLAARMYAELRASDCAYDLVLEGLGREFLGQLERRHSRLGSRTPPAWLREARERIHGSFTERLGLAALAESSGVDPSHFGRAFRKWFGCSVGAYVRRLRLQRASAQVAGTRLPLSEIAQAVGFYDQAHFTNSFKRHYGLTPAAYRKAMAAGRRTP